VGRLLAHSAGYWLIPKGDLTVVVSSPHDSLEIAIDGCSDGRDFMPISFLPLSQSSRILNPNTMLLIVRRVQVVAPDIQQL
jgi:hypothetical protein